MRKPRRLPIVLAAAGLFAALASGCVGYKPDSYTVGQVGGIGPLRMHLGLCSAVGNVMASSECAANDRDGEAQAALAFLVPRGSAVPATLSAVPGPGAAPIHYSLNAEFATVARGKDEAGQPRQLPPGTEWVGYLSAPYTEKAGEQLEWTVDADFGLPAAPDGGSFAGSIETIGVVGWRQVSGSEPASRPFDCSDYEAGGGVVRSACTPTSENFVPYALSQLKLGAPKTVIAFVGAKASLAFGLDFATTVATPPSFTLGATSTLPKAKATIAEPSFVAGAPDPATHRTPLATRTVKVAIPASAKPGTYDVTLTATASSGGVVTQVAKLKVTKPRLGFKVEPDKAKGTAILRVRVPSAGTLTVTGKGLFRVKRKPSKAKWVNLTLKPKGATKAALTQTGKAKVKAKFKFKPASGAAVTKTKAVTLVQR